MWTLRTQNDQALKHPLSQLFQYDARALLSSRVARRSLGRVHTNRWIIVCPIKFIVFSNSTTDGS